MEIPLRTKLAKFSGFWTSSPPPCQFQIHVTSSPLVRNWLTPSLPLSSGVIYVWPLSLWALCKEGRTCSANGSTSYPIFMEVARIWFERFLVAYDMLQKMKTIQATSNYLGQKNHIWGGDRPFETNREGKGARPQNSQCTGILSQIRTKLRDWAIGQAGAGCYSQAALSSNDSKTLYIT